jgi:hypothetical protein
MNKTLNITAGLAAGLISILVLNSFIQGIFVSIFFRNDPSYIFEGIRISAVFPLNTESFGLTFLAVILPLLSGILFIEVSLILFAKDPSGKISVFLILIAVINTGYLLIYIIPVIISVLINYIPNNNFVQLLKQSDLSYNQQLITVLATAVFIFGYINFMMKRMKRALPGIIENKKGKADVIKK